MDSEEVDKLNKLLVGMGGRVLRATKGHMSSRIAHEIYLPLDWAGCDKQGGVLELGGEMEHWSNHGLYIL